MEAFQYDLSAWKHAPFGGASGDQDIVILGLDWSAATFAMQVRADTGDAGTPYVSLTNAAAGVEGISAAYDAGYLHPVSGEAVGATTIRPQIAQATLETVPLAVDDPSTTIVLAYDFHVTPVGLPKMQLIYGAFNLNPGVTV